MTLVVDASVVVAALVDGGTEGQWARQALTEDHLVAPQMMPAEVTNILRRATLSGSITADSGALALNDALILRVGLFPFEPVAVRVWELRANITAYDAWYVALAEQLDATLVTLDERLARASGPQCGFMTP